MKLLGIGNNSKTIKSDKGGEYLTGILYLDPRNTKVCPYQEIARCKVACLNTAGRAGIIKKELQIIFLEREQEKQIYFLKIKRSLCG
jgi:hypothetical protein